MRFLFGLGLALCAACKSDPEPVGPTCGYHSDCGSGQVCFDGECQVTAQCADRVDCAEVAVCADERCFCDRQRSRCTPACITDNDCPSEGHCLNGICEPYPAQFNGMVPGGGARGQLQVGVAVVPLDFPMGVSMAGYGSRTGPRTPYRFSLGGSNAWFDRPDVRALWFDDGKENFLLMRIPLSWSTDYLLARTAEKVQERTGINLKDRIITSAPHSHSQPARFWHLVKGLGFGFFGYDEFSWEVFERLTDSFADAAVMAMETKQPARFGFRRISNFDPDNRIYRDRREHNNNLPGYLKKDDRLLIMRVDDMAGNPLVVLTNFGMHGTVFGGDNPVLTADAGGGVEVELGLGASAKYQRPVVAFYLQGNAGDVSPGGDDRQHTDFERLQVIGRRAWAVIDQELDQIQTTADIDVRLVTGRVPISHELLGYQKGEFFDSDIACEATAGYFRYGAFQCLEGRHNDEDPATKFEDGDLNCVFAVECLTDGYPVPQFQKTVLSVAKLGDLVLATMPGEPLSQFGRTLVEQIEAVVPGTQAAVIGYSQDHHFYLLNEADWLQGGYEPSRDIWGWRFGDYLIERSVAIATDLNAEPESRVYDSGNLKPMYWVLPADERTRVPYTETEAAPDTVTVDVPERLERFTEARFGWAGGHPGLDQPKVVLERETNGNFASVQHPGGDVYDDSRFEMRISYLGRCNPTNCTQHQWQVEWQQGRDFPVGRYRFRITGRAFRSGQEQDYSLTSRAFELVPTRQMLVSGLRANASQLEGRISDPLVVEFQPDGDGQRAVRSSFYLRSEEVPGHLGAPLADQAMLSYTGSVRAPGGMTTPLSGNVSLGRVTERRRELIGLDAQGQPRWNDERDRPTSTFVIDDALNGGAGDYFVSLTLTDSLGNLGTVTATITR